LCYEAKNTETRDEIVDKINFLIQYVHKWYYISCLKYIFYSVF
jgi:hypothetical protein